MKEIFIAFKKYLKFLKLRLMIKSHIKREIRKGNDIDSIIINLNKIHPNLLSREK